MNKEVQKIYLPQYKGESNPYDILWYLSIEIGRALIFKAKRIGMGIDDSVDALMKKYDEVFNEIEGLSSEEKDFLMKDSYFAKQDFYANGNETLLKLESAPASMMSNCSQLVSLDFLKATLGDDEGEKLYKYRCKLASISKRYTKEFLRSVVSYLDDSFESKEDGSIEKFISDNFDSKPSLHDITMMIDIKDTGYKFYNED